RVVVEVPCHEGDVDIARFPNRLAVVDRLEDGEEPSVLLDLAGQGVEVACPAVAAESAPGREGGAGGTDRGGDVIFPALCDPCDLLARGGVHDLEGLA